MAPLPWSGLHVLRFFHLLVSMGFLCPALVHLVFLKSQFTFEYILMLNKLTGLFLGRGLSSNQLKELPPGIFSNNTELWWL